jgi:hypothetical protein
MTLAGVTVYQNRTLKKQNEELRKDARLNINRPYIEIANIFFADSDYMVLDDLGDDPQGFILKNGIWSQTTTNFPPQMIAVKFKNAGNGSFIDLEYQELSHPQDEEVIPNLNQDTLSFYLSQLIKQKSYSFLLRYKNPANCIFWQEFKIEVSFHDKEENMTEEQKKNPVYECTVTIGSQNYELIEEVNRS